MSLQNLCIFLLAKKKTWKCIFNNNSELWQNRTKKQIMPSKTTVNWLFNDICYSFIACFDWKIAVSQQTVVTVYIISLICLTLSWRRPLSYYGFYVITALVMKELNWLNIRSEIWKWFLRTHLYISNISPPAQIFLTRKKIDKKCLHTR